MRDLVFCVLVLSAAVSAGVHIFSPGQSITAQPPASGTEQINQDAETPNTAPPCAELVEITPTLDVTVKEAGKIIIQKWKDEVSETLGDEYADYKLATDRSASCTQQGQATELKCVVKGIPCRVAQPATAQSSESPKVRKQYIVEKKLAAPKCAEMVELRPTLDAAPEEAGHILAQKWKDEVSGTLGDEYADYKRAKDRSSKCTRHGNAPELQCVVKGIPCRS